MSNPNVHDTANLTQSAVVEFDLIKKIELYRVEIITEISTNYLFFTFIFAGHHVVPHSNFPYLTASTSLTQAHFPYIYGPSNPTHITSVTSHHLPTYPYVYGWGPHSQHVSTSHVTHHDPYPYIYGWSSPFSQYTPNYGLPYAYPSGLFGSFPGYY